MIEVSNIYTDDLVKSYLQSDNRKLVTHLRSQAFSLYRSEISDGYIKTAFNKFRKGFVYFKDNTPVAFCMWKVYDYYKSMKDTFKDLLILLICGKKMDYRLGPRILDDVVHYCRKEAIQYITLEPANDLLKKYYMDCGFIEVNKETKLLRLNVSESRMGKRNTKYKISNIKTRKQKRYKIVKNSQSHKN
jgi:hypothetical protein